MALPLPRVIPDVGPGGMVGNVMRNVNALRQDMAGSRIKESEADYAPYTNYANALSKTAYAQYRPAEIAAQMMLSPAFRQLTPAIQNAMIQRYAGQLNNAPNTLLPPPGQINRGNNVFGMLMNQLMGGGQPQNPLAVSPVMGGGQLDQGGGGYSPPPVVNDGNINQGGGQGQGMIGTQTPAAGQTAGQTTPDSTGGYGPVDAAAAQAKAAETALVGQQQNQNTQQSERNKAISAQSIIANKASKILDGWYRNYKKSTYKGQRAGAYPASGEGSIPTLPGANSSPEELADNYSNQYLSLLSGLGDTPAGKTDAGREILSGSKVNRALDDDAAKEAYESQKAGLHRMLKSRNFVNDFYKNNPSATDEQLVAMMNLYDEHAPSYDYEKGKPLPNNDKKFKDFTSRQALQTYIQNGDYNPYEESNNDKGGRKPVEGVVEATVDMNGKSYHMINGKWHEDVK